MARIPISSTYVTNLKEAVKDCHAKKGYTYYTRFVFDEKDIDMLTDLKRLSDMIYYLEWLDTSVDSTDYVVYVKDEAQDHCDIKQEILNSDPIISPILYEDGGIILTEEISYFLEQEQA